MNYLNWRKLSLVSQFSNIGSEVERAISWKNKGNSEYSRLAFERSLELADLTINDPKNRFRLKEITRMREVLVDYFSGDNIYHSSDLLWQKYFIPFNWLARTRRD